MSTALVDTMRIASSCALHAEVAELEARLSKLRRELGLRQFTPGPWRVGKSGTVVANSPIGTHCTVGDAAYYGGYLICESIATERNARLIAAAPDMYALITGPSDEDMREYIRRMVEGGAA